MGGFSWIHWVIFLLVVAMIFGTSKLKNVGRDLGGAIRGFKDAMKEGEQEAGKKPEQLSQAKPDDASNDTSRNDKV